MQSAPCDDGPRSRLQTRKKHDQKKKKKKREKKKKISNQSLNHASKKTQMKNMKTLKTELKNTEPTC
jgi:hypothetical protein